MQFAGMAGRLLALEREALAAFQVARTAMGHLSTGRTIWIRHRLLSRDKVGPDRARRGHTGHGSQAEFAQDARWLCSDSVVALHTADSTSGVVINAASSVTAVEQGTKTRIWNREHIARIRHARLIVGCVQFPSGIASALHLAFVTTTCRRGARLLASTIAWAAFVLGNALQVTHHHHTKLALGLHTSHGVPTITFEATLCPVCQNPIHSRASLIWG
jgi:hypothetical protein